MLTPQQLEDGGPGILRSPILPPGQYGWINDTRLVADGTPEGIVALCKKAGLRGLLVKYNDGDECTAPIPWSANLKALAPVAKAAVNYAYSLPLGILADHTYWFEVVPLCDGCPQGIGCQNIRQMQVL